MKKIEFVEKNYEKCNNEDNEQQLTIFMIIQKKTLR